MATVVQGISLLTLALESGKDRPSFDLIDCLGNSSMFFPVLFSSAIVMIPFTEVEIGIPGSA